MKKILQSVERDLNRRIKSSKKQLNADVAAYRDVVKGDFTFTVTLDAGDGAGYDVLIDSVDPSVGSQTDLVFVYGIGYEYEADDEIDIAYTNTGTDTISGRYVYELEK